MSANDENSELAVSEKVHENNLAAAILGSLTMQEKQKTAESVNEAEQTMDGFYPDWWSGEQRADTVCIPACHDVGKTTFLGSSDPQSDTFNKLLFEKHERHYKGQEGEDAFLRAFQKLKLGGILISGFNSADYPALKKFKKQRLQEKFGIVDIEIDAIFIHPLVGIFAIEIKAIKKNNDNSDITKSDSFEKALSKQATKFLEQMPKIFKFICKEECHVPIYSAICFPFASLGENKPSSNIICIDETDFENVDRMRKMFEQKMTYQAESSVHVDNLKLFASAIAAYRSTDFTCAGCNALTVHNLIDSHKFGGLNKIEGSDIFWTNEQITILECRAEQQIITGPPGTGKTLILLQKALQAVLNGRKVFVSATIPELRFKFEMYLNKALREVLKDKGTSIIQPVIGDIDFGSEDHDFTPEYDDIFMDEFSCSAKHLEKFMKRCKRLVMVITGLFNPTEIENMIATVKQDNVEERRYFSMKTVIRSTREIFKEWKQRFSNAENSIRIGHNCRGSSVERKIAQNSDEILHEITEIIVKLQSNHAEIKSDFHSNLAIITTDALSLKIIFQFLAANGVRCGTVTEQMMNKNGDLVAICQLPNIISMEWPFVIVVSMISLDMHQDFILTAASRCMSQLFVIERDYMTLQVGIDNQMSDFREKSQSIDSVNIFMSAAQISQQFGETQAILSTFDGLYALIRHNFVPANILESMKELKECKTLFECFAKISSSELLCEWLLTNNDLHDAASFYSNQIMTLRDVPKTLFNNLCSNRVETESLEQWTILINMFKKFVHILERKGAIYDIDKLSNQLQVEVTLAKENAAYFSMLICILIR